MQTTKAGKRPDLELNQTGQRLDRTLPISFVQSVTAIVRLSQGQLHHDEGRGRRHQAGSKSTYPWQPSPSLQLNTLMTEVCFFPLREGDSVCLWKKKVAIHGNVSVHDSRLSVDLWVHVANSRRDVCTRVYVCVCVWERVCGFEGFSFLIRGVVDKWASVELGRINKVVN